MEKNLNFRALALIFVATLTASSANATEVSFVAKHKKAIIAGTALVLTAAATVYYFRTNLSEFANRLFAKKQVVVVAPVIEDASVVTTEPTFFEKVKNFFKGNSTPVVETSVEAPKVEDKK